MEHYLEQLKGGTIYIKNNSDIQMLCQGYRDLTNEIPINEETSFLTASGGKFFVAIGIAKLIEDNKLSLDTKIGDVLSFDLHQIDPNITIKELLTHTSGMPSYFDEKIHSDYSQIWADYPNYKIRSSKDLLPLFIHKTMEFNHGDHFSYNDSAFVLLGIIIEEITKVSFDDFLNDLIFQPLGMSHTGYYELDRLPKNCANAYIFDSKTNSYYTNIYSVDAKGSGAGGAFTNALDIEKLWSAYLNYQLLKKETVELMLTKFAEGEDGGYGLGVWLDDDLNPFIVGVDPGVTFISWHHRSNNQSITINSNYYDNVFKIFDLVKKDL